MTIGIGLGIAEFPFSGARGFWRWVELCEAEGVDSIWQTDRLVSTEPFLECMSVMAALAGATQRLKFGMNVASAGLRDPLLLAKQCATIDVLSAGRLLPAFGIGRAPGPEWQTIHRGAGGRGARTDEALDIISRLWSQEHLDYHGEHFHYTGAAIAPRPVQKRLPLWIGGSSAAAIRRTARVGTGWLSGIETPQQVAPVIAGIKVAAAELGRRIDDDHYGAGFGFRFGGWGDGAVEKSIAAFAKRTGRDARPSFAVGDAGDIVGRLGEYVAAGASKFVLRPMGDSDDDVIAQTKLLIAEVMPEVGTLGRMSAAP